MSDLDNAVAGGRVMEDSELAAQDETLTLTRSWAIRAFVAESNRIEGITRLPTPAEIDATTWLIGLKRIKVEDVENFVKVIQPDAVLRDKVGLNVRVGDYVAPPGGPYIREGLQFLLERVSYGHYGPYKAHQEYEHLHPFSDGNGRSGRAIWLWQMGDEGLSLPFLHRWYYQSLEASRL